MDNNIIKNNNQEKKFYAQMQADQLAMQTDPRFQLEGEPEFSDSFNQQYPEQIEEPYEDQYSEQLGESYEDPYEEYNNNIPIQYSRNNPEEFLRKFFSGRSCNTGRRPQLFDLSGRNHQLFKKYGGQKPGYDPRNHPSNINNIYEQRTPQDFRANPSDFKCNPTRIKKVRLNNRNIQNKKIKIKRNIKMKRKRKR